MTTLASLSIKLWYLIIIIINHHHLIIILWRLLWLVIVVLVVNIVYISGRGGWLLLLMIKLIFFWNVLHEVLLLILLLLLLMLGIGILISPILLSQFTKFKSLSVEFPNIINFSQTLYVVYHMWQFFILCLVIVEWYYRHSIVNVKCKWVNRIIN